METKIMLLHVPLTSALSCLSLTKERQDVKTRTQLYFKKKRLQSRDTSSSREVPRRSEHSNIVLATD